MATGAATSRKLAHANTPYATRLRRREADCSGGRTLSSASRQIWCTGPGGLRRLDPLQLHVEIVSHER